MTNTTTTTETVDTSTKRLAREMETAWAAEGVEITDQTRGWIGQLARMRARAIAAASK